MKYGKADNFIIRPADAGGDAKGVNATRLQPEIMKTIASLPSDELQSIRQLLENRTDKFFVAEMTGQPGLIAGFLALRPSRELCYRHRADLGIMVHRDYHRQGIGRALMETALETADEELGLKRIELSVDISNAGAIRLYEGMGFKKEGVLRKTTVTCGKHIDDLLMGRIAPAAALDGCGESIGLSEESLSTAVDQTARGDYLLRPVDIKDAADICRLLAESGTPRTLEEIQRDLESPDAGTHRFVAVGDGNVSGFAVLSVPRVQRLRHGGSISAVASHENEFGIIDALIGGIINLAEDWLLLVRLESTVLTGDAGKIAAYKKRGFEIEARKEKSVFHNGNYLDEYMLGRVKGTSLL